ncbi:isoprenylcysteine carboxyl methyltransferase family protein [Brevibacillus migulae]|uniref:isoprenylcysteine carboxyl methyltransferase family protein n=1 Tax=Brevibacillus migulae TaxID=1644114 RepID=UPI00106E6FB9|nr:isoprenylcysteine carboxylmethyltransferase family protein [Brevibacillus migulae]
MRIFFGIVILIVILQRLVELRLAKQNRDYILSQGGHEAGASHYKYIVLLHILFFLCLMVEGGSRQQLPAWWWAPFAVFLLAQAGRYWCIRTLGRHWNTRIMILPGTSPIRRGPYRYLRHPNYWVVTIELLALPLCFGAFYTAVLFPVSNLLLLGLIRIPIEEHALHSLNSQDQAVEPTLNEDSPD